MNRTDRLLKILNFLQGRRRAVTAERIACECEVSVRTIYRDIKELTRSGVPIDGEAGVGYLLDEGYHLPALTFDIEEIESLVLGMAMVCNWTDDKMARSARSTLDKIKTAIPEKLLNELHGTTLFSFRGASYVPWTVDFSLLRASIRQKQKIEIEYSDGKKTASKRIVRPLGMAFFGPVWLLMGWCELREDFRNFRLDRILEMKVLDDVFIDEAGKRLNDYCDNGLVDELRK